MYQLKDETSTSVIKSTRVNDPDLNLESADKLFDKMNALILGGPKAITFRSVPALGDAPVSTCAGVQPAVEPPVTPQPIATGETESETGEQCWQAHWQSFRSGAQAAAPKTSAKAKATPKATPKTSVSKRKRGTEHGDMMPPPPKEGRKSSIINLNPVDQAEPHSPKAGESQKKRKELNSTGDVGAEPVFQTPADPVLQDADAKWQKQFEEKYRNIFTVAIKHENPVDDAEVTFVKNTLALKVKEGTKFLNDVACPLQVLTCSFSQHVAS